LQYAAKTVANIALTPYNLVKAMKQINDTTHIVKGDSVKQAVQKLSTFLTFGFKAI
jgi:hypothetical protein